MLILQQTHPAKRNLDSGASSITTILSPDGDCVRGQTGSGYTGAEPSCAERVLRFSSVKPTPIDFSGLKENIKGFVFR